MSRENTTAGTLESKGNTVIPPPEYYTTTETLESKVILYRRRDKYTTAGTLESKGDTIPPPKLWKVKVILRGHTNNIYIYIKDNKQLSKVNQIKSL